MSAKQHFFLYFFLLIAVPTFTQITKGSKTIGSANLGYQSSSQSYMSGNNTFDEYSSYSLGFYLDGPQFMLTNHLQLGLGFGLDISKNNFSTDNNGNKIYEHLNSFSLKPEMTYYFNNKFYANIGGAYTPLFYKETNSTDIEIFKRQTKGYTLKFGIGYLLPINEQVFLNGLAGIEYQNVGQIEYSLLGISVGLINFVPSIFGKKSEDTPQYLESGRSIIEGGLHIQYTYERGGSVSIGGAFSRLKFRNNHFAFGYYGGASLNILPNKNDFYYANLGTKARYYIPMSKHWFIYPELGLGFDFNKSNGNTRVNFVLTKTVGFNYFMTKNVALDANISFGINSIKPDDLQRNTSITNFNSNINFGVTYFIDKLF
jgi:Autotransporter beta-domain